MRTYSVRRLWLHTIATLALLALAASNATAQGFRWPEEPENLQVLPADVKGAALGQVMRGFVSALGVRCEYCHMGEGNDLTQFDFASDERLTKRKARVMIRMVQAINQTHLAELTDLGVAPDDRVEVTCITCHRSQNKPLMLGDLLEATIDSAGVDAAVEQYSQLREEYYGGFAYDFGSRTLIALGERLAGAGKVDAALRMLELEIEVNGESPNVYWSLGGVQARADMRDAAIESYERGEKLASEDVKRFFRQAIERLRAQ